MKTAKIIQMLDAQNNNISPEIGIEGVYYEQENNGVYERHAFFNDVLFKDDYNEKEVIPNTIADIKIEEVSTGDISINKVNITRYKLDSSIATTNITDQLSADIHNIQDEYSSYISSINVSINGLENIFPKVPYRKTLSDNINNLIPYITSLNDDSSLYDEENNYSSNKVYMPSVFVRNLKSNYSAYDSSYVSLVELKRMFFEKDASIINNNFNILNDFAYEVADYAYNSNKSLSRSVNQINSSIKNIKLSISGINTSINYIENYLIPNENYLKFSEDSSSYRGVLVGSFSNPDSSDNIATYQQGTMQWVPLSDITGNSTIVTSYDDSIIKQRLSVLEDKLSNFIDIETLDNDNNVLIGNSDNAKHNVNANYFHVYVGSNSLVGNSYQKNSSNYQSLIMCQETEDNEDKAYCLLSKNNYGTYNNGYEYETFIKQTRDSIELSTSTYGKTATFSILNTSIGSSVKLENESAKIELSDASNGIILDGNVYFNQLINIANNASIYYKENKYNIDDLFKANANSKERIIKSNWIKLSDDNTTNSFSMDSSTIFINGVQATKNQVSDIITYLNKGILQKLRKKNIKPSYIIGRQLTLYAREKARIFGKIQNTSSIKDIYSTLDEDILYEKREDVNDTELFDKANGWYMYLKFYKYDRFTYSNSTIIQDNTVYYNQISLKNCINNSPIKEKYLSNVNNSNYDPYNDDTGATDIYFVYVYHIINGQIDYSNKIVPMLWFMIGDDDYNIPMNLIGETFNASEKLNINGNNVIPNLFIEKVSDLFNINNY